MKSFAKIIIIALLVISLAFVLSACSSSGGGGERGHAESNPTNNATASASQAASIGTNAGATLSNLLGTGTSGSGRAVKFRSPLAGKDARFKKINAAQVKALKTPKLKLAAAVKKAKAAAAGLRTTITIPSATESCLDSGSWTYSGSYDDTTYAYSLAFTFNHCREYDEELNGSMTFSEDFASGTGYASTYTMKLGDGDNIVESGVDFEAMLFTANYVDLYATYIADMTITGTDACSDTYCTTYTSTFTANGKEQYYDFIDTYTITYSSLQFAGSDTFTSTGYTGSYTIGGGFSEGWTGASGTEGVAITFTNFVMGWTDTGSYYDYSVDGTVAMDFTPNDYCYEGTFTIDTTTPVRYDYATWTTTQGAMTVTFNSNTVTIVFNSDGTVTVTDSSGSHTYTSIEDVEATCPIQDFGEDSTTTTDAGGSTVTTTGSTLLATLSWTGTGCPTTGCTSDMDLHLAHYATQSPSSSSVQDWHIYYADKTSGGYGELDYDDVEGYGPEHITMNNGLPSGYYMLYVDPYSLDSDSAATVNVTLKIGSNSYTFDTHTFSSSSDPDYRVCDIKVDGSGNVTIMPPNNSLTTWAPGVSQAPKAR